METISVIIPAYNVELFLKEAIESVLAQNYPSMEILVITGPSTDRTTEIAKSFGEPVIIIPEEKPSDGAARNTGINHSKGAILAFLDADDFWAPGKIEKQMRLLKESPSLEAVLGFVQEFSEDEAGNRISGNLLPAPVPGTILIRKDSFLRVGLYEENYTLAAISSWYMRAIDQKLQEVWLTETILYRRINKQSLGHRHKDKQVEYARALKAHLDRKRGRQPK